MADKIQDFFNMHPDDQSQMGAQLMQSGQVSANDVAQAHSLLQTPEGQDWLGQYLKPKGKIDPYTLNPVREPASDPAASPNPLVKAPGKRVSTKSYQPTAPDKIAEAAEGFRNLPEVADQQKSLKDQEDQLNMQMAQPMSPSSAWIKPLLALTDSQTGSHLMEGYTAPETMAQRNARLMKMQDEVQKRKGDLAKELLGAVSKDKGTTTNIITGDQLGGLGGARRLKLISDAGAAFDKDPVILAATKTNNSLDRAVGILQGKAPVTSKTFNIAQQDIINATAAGGAATEGKVNREMVSAAQLKLNDIMNYVKDHPGDIRDSEQGRALVKQGMDLINQVKEDYANAAAQRVDDLHNNFLDVPDEAIQNTVRRKVETYKGRFRPAPSAGGGASPLKEGDTKDWQGSTYKVQGGHWVKQ